MNTIEQIVLHFGHTSQIFKAKEELIELLQALDSEDADNITEEIADVEIMLEQLKYIYNCVNDVEAIKQYKIDRTLKIMRGECKISKCDRPPYCGKIKNACEKCKNRS